MHLSIFANNKIPIQNQKIRIDKNYKYNTTLKCVIMAFFFQHDLMGRNRLARSQNQPNPWYIPSGMLPPRNAQVTGRWFRVRVSRECIRMDAATKRIAFGCVSL